MVDPDCKNPLQKQLAPGVFPLLRIIKSNCLHVLNKHLQKHKHTELKQPSNQQILSLSILSVYLKNFHLSVDQLFLSLSSCRMKHVAFAV